MRTERNRLSVATSALGAVMGLFVILMVAVMGLVLLLSQTGHRIEVPAWAKEEILTLLSENTDDLVIEVGEVAFFLGKNGRPGLVLENLTVQAGDTVPLAEFREISLEIALEPLLNRQVVAKSLIVSGAVTRLSQDETGRFALAFSNASEGGYSPESLAEVFDAAEAVLSRSVLAGIERAEVRDLELLYRDAVDGSEISVTDGRFTLTQTDRNLAMNLGFRVHNDGSKDALVTLAAESQLDDQGASFGAQVDNVPAQFIARFVPSLAWLSALDAPISGALRSGLADDGLLQDVNGSLEIGKGAVRPTQDVAPVSFQSGKVYFSYDHQTQKITFFEISIDSEAVDFIAEGHAYLQDFRAGSPRALVAQLQFGDLALNPKDWFEMPLQLDGGALDFKFRFDPFKLSIGQMVIFDGANRYHAKGEIEARPDGWAVSLDASAPILGNQRLVELWPQNFKIKSRNWIQKNVQHADGFNGRAALRIAPGQAPRFSAGFEFDNASVRYLKAFPLGQKGRGYGTIEGHVFSLTLERGEVLAPSGDVIDVAGTVLNIPDMRIKPAPGRIDVRTHGALTGILSLIDLPPLNLMQKSDTPVDVAQGTAVLQAHIEMPFKKKVQPEEISYDVSGDILNLRSDSVVPGHELTSDRLSVSVNHGGITLSGAGAIGDLPFDAVWSQKRLPDQSTMSQNSRVEATVELSTRLIDEFNLEMPNGLMSGSGLASVRIDLQAGKAQSFSLTSDLDKLALNLPQIGWHKAKSSQGVLEIQGQLAPTLSIDHLTVQAPGLLAKGTIDLTEDRTFDTARFSELKIGNWLNGRVELRGRGPGLGPAVSVLSGRADLRNIAFGGGGGGSGANSGPLDVSLDRLTLSQGLYLSDVRGRFSPQPAMNGSFTGRINGAAPIKGTLVPNKNGTSIRIQSNDAGAVIRAAGLVSTAYDGNLDLILTPRGEKGHYLGRMVAKKMKIRGASVLAELLGAISVIGLLEQLNGQGIVFSDVEADFILTPTRIAITRSSAVGPSLGVSMDGTYDVVQKRIDMQGVISPIYLLNGIGAVLTRRGEGLFGFNFNLTGTADVPKISVNPLSILTPGMFREIFRRPAPKLAE